MNLLKSLRGNGRGLERRERPNVLRFRNEFDRLFDRFFEDPWGVPEMAIEPGLTWTPAVDVIENENAITVRAELPGMELKDIDVSVTGNLLTVSGEKTQEQERRDDVSCCCERSFGSFRRTLELPQGVELSKVTAQYANGVLTVSVPKPATARARHVEVKPAANGAAHPQRVEVGAAAR